MRVVEKIVRVPEVRTIKDNKSEGQIKTLQESLQGSLKEKKVLSEKLTQKTAQVENLKKSLYESQIKGLALKTGISESKIKQMVPNLDRPLGEVEASLTKMAQKEGLKFVEPVITGATGRGC